MSTLTHKHWQDVYAKKPVDSLSWTTNRIPAVAQELIGIAKASAPLKRVVDLGGGASPFAAELVRHQTVAERITVVDVSENALAIAKKGLEEQVFSAESPALDWVVADVREFNQNGEYGQYDLVHDRAVYHFLTEKKDRLSYSQMLYQTLRPGGWLLIGTFALPDGPLKCSGLNVERYDADKLKQELNTGYSTSTGNEKRYLELIESRNETHTTPSGAKQKFIYCLFNDKASM
ncbi:S-adenosyl-L-methionine-dependent methyltransferase [Basidiobolus meristosporus CBS 931.73]|uniref:S-adenosyl-L-methionine-dependent methyltransferase n=1 Tax=Basidiobolus meristosporus CBS 931.73 TaxID=1314790 RepID=A0A1Y1YNP7_9FUNG|nr:S-adenosyl-L-methionine-dependent methyltransferase [Basidiobolus meristosporus CBS 931.73]|eukprot:ORX99386.1 S-adenosyl-L-methionine-dependent methyltransferase [Basidiobolus meristosporus CBS 931.73]